MPYFNIVAETSENTVVTEYEPVKKRSDSYQSEAELEQEFIRMLCEQGYEYLSIHTESDLILNLRNKLEELNDYHFSDTEWQQFFKDNIANPNEHIVEKTRKIQEDNVQVLIRDNGSTKNIMLIDKTNIHNNKLQVINQYKIGMEEGENRINQLILELSKHGRTDDIVKAAADLEISKNTDFKKYLNQYEVIHLDIQWCMEPAGGAEQVVLQS